MSYVTTNIRLPEEDYLRLKEEAAKKRKSLAAVIREKVGVKKIITKSPEEIFQKIRADAKKNAKYFPKVDSATIIREMRDNAKW